MSNEVYDFNIGHSTAYAYAKASGDLPEGMTPEEYGELLASYATVGQTAVTAAQTATTKASEAATSATTATNKASEAATSATTATTAAEAAQADADAAALDASQALSAASTATTKATEATTAAATAVSAKDDAVSANTAAQSAKTAAQTAQTGAETAAASVSASAAQITQNTSDISELKEDLTTKADLDELYKAFPTDTASGSVASFADGANVPVKSLIVDITPVQSGSGDPSPTNVRPISGWSQVNVGTSGKNLAELTDPPLTTTTSQAVAQLNQKGTFNYTVSFDLINATYQTGSGALIALVDENGAEYRTPGQIRRVSDNTYISALTQPINGRFYCTFVSKVNPVRVTIFFMIESYCKWTGEMKNLQVELGATPTDFEPYAGTSLTIPLGQTVYGGTLDVTNGVLTVDRTMVDLGTLDYRYNVADSLAFDTQVTLTLSPKNNNCICSNYKNLASPTFSNILNNDKFVAINARDDGTPYTGSYTKGTLIVKDTAYTDATAFKSAMSGVMLCYPLATPLTVQLTPHEVTALLGSNNVWADTGDSTVEYRADPTLYIQRLTEPDADMVADANITSGQYFMVGNTLYKATANIASGGAITPNVNCTRKSLSEALNELNV